MEGYRAGLILSLPQFDTYGTLERFARFPDSREALIGYLYLRKAAKTRVRWDVSSRATSREDAEKLYNARLGIMPRHTPAAFSDMSQEQLKNLYSSLCADIDPASLVES